MAATLGIPANATCTAVAVDALGLMPTLDPTSRMMKEALSMVPRPVLLAGAAYVSAVSAAAGFVSKPLRPLSSLSLKRSSVPPAAPHMTCAMHGCTVRTLAGSSITVPLAPDMTLRQVQEAAQLASGLHASQQRVLVLEERGDILQPRPTLGSLAKAAAQSLAYRPSAKAAHVGWVNFFFLPEVINREWAGRGLLAWAHTHLVTPLRRRSADPAAAAACIPVTLQALSGATATIEFDGVAIVADVHAAIRGRFGVSLDRQSLVIAERQPTGLVARSADAALTAGVRSARVAFESAAAARALFSCELEALSAFGTRRYTAQAMQSALSRIRGLGEPNITMRLQTPAGRVLLSVPQGTSIGEVAALAQEARGNITGEPLQLLLTPPRAPPATTPPRLPAGGLMSPLPPVAAAVPGTQRRPPLWQSPQQQQQQAGEVAAAAAAGLDPAAAAATPGEAAAEAAVVAARIAPGFSGSSAAPSQLLHSPFAASPEPLARKLDAEFRAASGGKTPPSSGKGGGGKGGLISGSLRTVLHPTKALSRVLSSRIGSLSP